jgi:hypothetical protein
MMIQRRHSSKRTDSRKVLVAKDWIDLLLGRPVNSVTDCPSADCILRLLAGCRTWSKNVLLPARGGYARECLHAGAASPLVVSALLSGACASRAPTPSPRSLTPPSHCFTLCRRFCLFFWLWLVRALQCICLLVCSASVGGRERRAQALELAEGPA